MDGDQRVGHDHVADLFGYVGLPEAGSNVPCPKEMSRILGTLRFRRSAALFLPRGTFVPS